ncbi:MAG: hypothetical protein EOO16_08070 [Chitinophagaceae bacterium]|nr:MAG: hypothetical protein EOO16_08070 [Chitinophagaceae bacterium]
MTILFIFFILLLLAGTFYLQRSGRFVLPVRRRARKTTQPPQRQTADGPVPAAFEEDVLEQEDLEWALRQRRAALEKEKALHLTRESAARIDAIDEGIRSLERRLLALQERMGTWKESLLELEELRTAHAQLQAEHLELQYRLQSLSASEDELKQALAEARREALADWEEKESLQRQLALLRNLVRDE